MARLDSKAGKTNRFNLPAFLMFEKKEDDTSADANTPTSTLTVSDEEWAHAARATRNATWGAVFYLITTDLFGPMSIP